jgi:hypothetical protein
MYLRFVVADIDEDSEPALGVFHAVWTLRDAGKLYAHEEDQHDSVRWRFDDNLEQPTRFNRFQAPVLSQEEQRFHGSKTPVLTASAMGELARFLAAIMGLRPRATDTAGRRFRPRAEHGSLAVWGREWTRNGAIPTRRSVFPDSAKAPKYAERPQTGPNPPTSFIPRDFRPSFGAGKRATFCPSGG